MDKTTRLQMIKSRFAALFGKPLENGFVSVSRREIRDIGSNIRSAFADSMNDATTSGDEITLRSTLGMIAGNLGNVQESDFVLSAKEKRILRNEIRLAKFEKGKQAFADSCKMPLLLMG